MLNKNFLINLRTAPELLVNFLLKFFVKAEYSISPANEDQHARKNAFQARAAIVTM